MYFIYKIKNTKIDNMTTSIFNSEQYLNTGELSSPWWQKQIFLTSNFYLKAQIFIISNNDLLFFLMWQTQLIYFQENA